MKVTIESSRIVKPIYEGNPPPVPTDCFPLTVFDKVQFNAYQGLILAYRPPTPRNADIELGLRKVLSVYRACAGRLGETEKHEPAILLNDGGARFVEAFTDCTLVEAMPLHPSPSLLSLYPNTNDTKELVQVQLTRFTCGSLVMGYNSHHLLSDGQAQSNFLVAWGQACKGLEINPLPSNDRTSFIPRDPPKFEFDHQNAEYMSGKLMNGSTPKDIIAVDDLVVHKVHFTPQFLAELKGKASSSNGNDKPFSTFQCIVAHLWRVITKVRALPSWETTHMRIAVNGRPRLSPKVPNDYFGNLVLWAFPTTKVEVLLEEPLSYVARLVHDAISKVNNNYFRSFIDFSNHKVQEEQLVPSADADLMVLRPNVEVDSWLSFRFSDLDFGGGPPFSVVPSFVPVEGLIFLLPSNASDGSIDAFIPLFKDNLTSFKQSCYSI